MSKVYVISTMTSSVSYTFYEVVDNLPRVKDKIVIHGGANLPSMRSGFGEVSQDGEGSPMWTAAGIVTPISTERYEKLKDHHIFQKHLAAGRVSVSEKDVEGNHREVKRIVSGMEARDGFAQLTPTTFKQKVKVTTEMKSEGNRI
ncbi:hypothetical protein XccvBFoX7_gp13 [Xanthomonas phage FoX7]|uniref:Uncharacterized protein n=2 Tax=Carpasinavirus XcP1 TaxID=2182344 RepID=A0A858NPY2_9CAUD|nr:hypothetical protein XccvBFoX6_gp13 [Xanthomonas phage FoX6]QJB22170.1 hypothetical protein XccvBFoX7_gp13 [Xanthomonas phage FoX7]